MNTTIQNISLVGSGNVASHLGQAFQQAGLNVVEVYSPNPENANKLASDLGCQTSESLAKLRPGSDLYLLAVPDARVAEVAGNIQNQFDGIVAHTSGITPIDSLSRFAHHGVFYPLQTFTKGRGIDISSVPICLEASDQKVFEALSDLALRISKNIYPINSQQRKLLHLSAVLVNNFSNHLFHLAESFLKDNDLSFDILKPLIRETAAKAIESNPTDAQTGPARRGDASTIRKHFELLENETGIRDLYKIFSEQISKEYHE